MKKSMIKIIIGLVMIATVVVGYLHEPENLIELTCIANMLGGVLLFIDGILNIIGKKKPISNLYMNVCICIFMVLIVSFGGLSGIYKLNFKGAYFFLHVINPITFITCYMFFCNDYKKKIRFVLTAPILMIIYLLFDYIQCQFTGKFVYGFVEPKDMSLFYALITGIVIYIFTCLIACGLFGLNKLIHRKQ